MDHDYALRVDKPIPLSNTSTQDEKSAYEKWERFNRLSLMIMKDSISSDIREGVPDSENAKDFLDSVEEQFQSSSKALATTLIIKMGFCFTRKLNKGECKVLVGNGNKVPIEAVGTLPLVLESGFKLNLFDTVYVPSITRKLISVSRLVTHGYSILFENKDFTISNQGLKNGRVTKIGKGDHSFHLQSSGPPSGLCSLRELEPLIPALTWINYSMKWVADVVEQTTREGSISSLAPLLLLLPRSCNSSLVQEEEEQRQKQSGGAAP
ncbi:hypothetical protein ZIOFF_065843 [Zingiber officinale]|uniref:Retrovirus-related Pol polyprotein from transposon TNT 1-94-like beta-barrel domain-containing protein n=1 Tax=Zingiber officinale TaxID=94328 RepID=A0A8J5KDF2_ZINOF|nr:hypothetical protein ZIOFF_065843 [Zingiber officinale]